MRAKQKFKKGTFSRRVFSILMALAMVITLMPMNAMEVKAEDATGIQITSMTLNVDWSKIPTLTVGKSAPSFEEPPVTVSGTGVDRIAGYGWVVKALESHVVSGYLDRNVYNGYEKSDHWVPLERYKNYTINATDTYACFIGSRASDGYCFAEEDGVDLKNIVTSNVNVARILSDGNGSSAVAFLELGTVSAIAAARSDLLMTTTSAEVFSEDVETLFCVPDGAVDGSCCTSEVADELPCVSHPQAFGDAPAKERTSKDKTKITEIVFTVLIHSPPLSP